MKKLLFIFSLVLLIQCSSEKTKFDFDIPFEKSKGTETATYEQTIEFCKKLANASNRVKYEVFGQSGQGRELPVLIVSKNKCFTPTEIRKNGNIIILIQANIHPGEPDGNDAGMLLLRDIVVTKTKESLLDHVTILFIPVFNADGLARFNPYNRINQNGPKEMGWRTTATNLNLNRDFLKADAPEMQAWLKLFNKWLPDFFIDCHATDGADYQYVITYGLDLTSNSIEELTNWEKEVYLEDLEMNMLKKNLPIFPYVSFRRWHDPRSGLYSGYSNPMLSTGYAAAHNRPALLIESHMLKPFKQRVLATYEMLRITLEILNKEYVNLKSILEEADKYTSSADFRNKDFALGYKVSVNDSMMVDFLGYEYDIITSELTGGLWFRYHNDKPVTYKIPYFNKLESTVQVRLPEAYVVPAEWQEVISKLSMHGIKYTKTKEPKEILIKTYKFKNVTFGGGSYFESSGPREGRFTVTFKADTITEKRIFPSGSIIIDMNQRSAKIIANLLEPEAPSSLLHWGFFNSIFEQKEYSETYVMEKLAREMLEKDPKLKEEFELMKKDNPAFANNQWLICNWFYSKSLWWDYKKDVYPIGLIFDRKLVDDLIK